MEHREFKDRLYAQFARVGKALASEKRLELLDLLAQGPRRVDALAVEAGIPVANVSQHLQALSQAHLVEASKDGTQNIYRLADERVLKLWLTLREVAETRLAEVDQIKRDAGETLSQGRISRNEVRRLAKKGKMLLLDVRPAIEYESGHLPGAISIPVDALEARLGELPRNLPIVTYCRGEYCLFADDAVALLRKHGFEAVRMEGGWPEWAAEGRSKKRVAAKVLAGQRVSPSRPAAKSTSPRREIRVRSSGVGLRPICLAVNERALGRCGANAGPLQNPRYLRPARTATLPAGIHRLNLTSKRVQSRG